MSSRSRNGIFWAILLAFIAGLVEFGCFAVARARPDLFDHRAAVLAKLEPQPFERFKALQASPERGWDNPRAQTLMRRICTGAQVPHRYGPVGERLHGNDADAVILIAGDSWTHGDDVADGDTYPAALERALGVPTANLGVGGYDPVQALLKLEATVAHFPKARIAVLSILDEDVLRMPNSYRPVLFPATGIVFGLKPFTRGGAVQGLPGGDPFVDLDAMRRAAQRAFDADYWRRPPARFPYALAVADMLTSPSFWVPQWVEAGRLLGYRQFEMIYRLPAVRDGLRAVYARFAAFAQAHGLVPVIAFIPTDPEDRTSGAVAIAAAAPEQRAAITFTAIAVPEPGRYRPLADCHPQADGYRMIAESIAPVLRSLLAQR